MRQVIGLLQLRSTLSWLDHEQGQASAAPEACASTAIHFVVPVLHEQDHVVAMMSWFATLLEQLPGSTLTVVTSEREAIERRCTGPAASSTSPTATTADVAAAALREHGWGGRVRHEHYEGEGRKAAQVNHAIEHLDSPGYVAVYDVDSRPSLELLLGTLELLARHRHTTGQWPAVVQQSARFVTADQHPVAWQRSVCRGAATLQTLWTLRRELPSFRRYATCPGPDRAGWAVLRRGLAQTVGHGLLVRTDVLRVVGGFPTYTVLDDLPFGYRLSVLGVGVSPIPALTTVPAPDSVVELLAQGQRWFHNYLDYPLCARHARSDGAGSAWSRGVALAIGGYRGITWLLRSPGAASVALLIAPGVGSAARMAAGVALAAGTVAPIRILARADGRHLRPGRLIAESSELLAAALISSVGPARAIAHRISQGQPCTEISPKAAARADAPTSVVQP